MSRTLSESVRCCRRDRRVSDPRRRSRDHHGGRGRAQRPHVHASRRLHDGARRRAAARRSADRGRLRRARDGSTSPSRRARTTRSAVAAREQAAPDPPARGHRRRRPVRPADRVRRPDDVSRRDALVRRLALRRGAAEHLEADRHRRRRRGRPPRGVVPGQDAHRLRQRPARALSRSRRLDLLVQGGLRRTDLRAARPAAVRHQGGAHLPLPARRQRRSSR